MEFARQLQATVDPAIKDRDQRMYEAKEKGISRWCCFQKCLGKKHRLLLLQTVEM